MAALIGDTIFAVASPPGAAQRGVIRVSGPAALRCAGVALAAPDGGGDGAEALPRRRAVLDRCLAPYAAACPVLVLVMPSPRSFTGEDVVEFHLPGSPLLLAKVGDRLRAAGARDATPGEFTRRAFEHGRLTLLEAEAVGALIHAASVGEARRAIDTLRGGWSVAVERCRGLTQDGLALLEVGLDFDADETGAVASEEWIERLERARGAVAELAGAAPSAQARASFVLLGVTNAGKSSLCNALSGRQEAMAAAERATTRDVLAIDIGQGVTVFDTPGDIEDAVVEDSAVDRAALALRDRLAGRAAAAVLVLDLSDPRWPAWGDLPVAAVVWSQSDRVEAADGPSAAVDAGPLAGLPQFVVSSVTGRGVEALRAFLRSGGGRGATQAPDAAPARLAAQAQRAAQALDEALVEARAGAAPEMVACAVQDAVAALDAIDGRSSPEDLLDRIFGAFCLGK